MDGMGVSAFAAYAAKKKNLKKHKSDMFGLKNKTKVKLRKKKKKQSQNNAVKGMVKNVGKNNIIESVRNVMEKEDDKLFGCHKVLKTMKKRLKNGLIDGSCIPIDVNGTCIQKINADKIINGYSIGSVNNVETETNVKKFKKKKKNTNSGESEVVPSNSQTDDNVQGRKIIRNANDQRQMSFPSIIYGDSVKMGEDVLSWILSPMNLKDFFDGCWEKKPLHIKRNDDNFFKCICTLKDFKYALKQNNMYFTKNIDVTSYVNGERTTENPEGKATLPVVWDFLDKGRSIRLLNPQTFIPNVRLLNTTLQEFLQCFVGANIYLTPAGTQGFAPHYDDIEAFVLQLDGEKHWKLYNPRCPEEVLPRVPSPNFREDELGEPIMEVTLKPGDLLYFPRGIIHQAKCLTHTHSLHITVSCYQKNTWADLLEKIVPVALQQAISEDVEFRKGLPVGYLSHMGMMFSDQTSHFREEMLRKLKKLILRVFEFCPLDAAADQMGVDFMQDAMPPCLTEEERIYGADRSARYQSKHFLDVLKNYSDKNLGVKLIRSMCARLVSEEDIVYLYYTTDNSLVYHEAEVSCVEIPVGWTLAVEHLVRSYPNFVEMKSLPVMKEDEKPGKWKQIADFVYFLWQRGLVLFDKPHRSIYGPSSNNPE